MTEYALPPLSLPPRQDGSCDLHRYHGSAQPRLLQAHHVFPVFLQREAWGETREMDTAAVCGTGHDTVHVILRAVLRGDVEPTDTPPLDYRLHRAEWRLAVQAHRRYVAALNERKEPTA